MQAHQHALVGAAPRYDGANVLGLRLRPERSGDCPHTRRTNPSEDSVIVIDLGQAGNSSRFPFLGHHDKLPVPSAVIV